MRKMLLAILVLLLVVSCKMTLPEVTELPTVGTGLARVEADVDTARNLTQKSKPHANNIGNALLDGAIMSLDDAKAEVGKLKVTLATVTGQVDAVTAQRDTLAVDLKAERNHWVGYKTRLWAKAIIITAVAGYLVLGVGGALLKGFFPAGRLFLLGRGILRVLPFANPFSSLASRIRESRGSTNVNINVGSKKE